jgi:hypothetical protein
LADARHGGQVIVIVADVPFLLDPINQNVIRAVDAAGGEQAALVVVPPDAPVAPLPAALPAPADQLAVTLQGLFPTSFDKFWHKDWSSARTPKALEAVLADAVVRIRSRLQGQAPATPAVDPAVVASAAARGQAIERQPMVSGPGEVTK